MGGGIPRKDMVATYRTAKIPRPKTTRNLGGGAERSQQIGGGEISEERAWPTARLAKVRHQQAFHCLSQTISRLNGFPYLSVPGSPLRSPFRPAYTFSHGQQMNVASNLGKVDK
jgi:hypothetical protein